MNPFRMIISGLLLLLPVLAFTQTNSDPASKIPGKWLLVKHLLTENGKTEDLLTSNEVYTYDFAKDGTYEVTFINKKNASTTVYKGKWKILPGGKKLKLYDNSLPSDPKQLVNDKIYPVIRLSATEFVTKELLFGMDLLGTSYYYKKQ